MASSDEQRQFFAIESLIVTRPGAMTNNHTLQEENIMIFQNLRFSREDNSRKVTSMKNLIKPNQN